jgi:hypothetical protein
MTGAKVFIGLDSELVQAARKLILFPSDTGKSED